MTLNFWFVCPPPNCSVQAVFTPVYEALGMEPWTQASTPPTEHSPALVGALGGGQQGLLAIGTVACPDNSYHLTFLRIGRTGKSG